MDIKIRKWSHDWEHFNFAGVELAYDGNADGITSLSAEDVMEYLEWLAINQPEKYGQLMMSTMGVIGGESIPKAVKKSGLLSHV